MINSLQSTSIFGVANSLQSRAAHSGVVHDLRTGDGQELESRHVKQVPPDEPPHAKQEETKGQEERSVQDEEVSYDTVARRVEEARIAAEESAKERTVEARSVDKPPAKPLEQEVERGSRRARIAHQVAARYIMTVQGYAANDPARMAKSSAGQVDVQA